ncbi:hypothetical protein FQA39_LY15229 [Lamprigera yunnana]|nr:hypothetical protein FQA39_LY15229 [Lamprigera yunnana]
MLDYMLKMVTFIKSLSEFKAAAYDCAHLIAACLSNKFNDTAERPDMIVKCISSSYVAVVRSDKKEYSDTVADDARKNNGERTLSVLSPHSFDAAFLQYLQEDRSEMDT